MAPYYAEAKNGSPSLVESVGCEGVSRYSESITECALAVCRLDAYGSLPRGFAAVLSRATALSLALVSRCYRVNSIPA
jgi:hypothetical protein